MYLIYFDERKYQKESHKFYILGGIIININKVSKIENQLDTLAFNYFKNKNRDISTEFHARDMIHNGKTIYKDHDLTRRMKLYKDILFVIEENKIDVMYVNIDAEKTPLAIKNLNHWALMMFIEKAEILMRNKSSSALLIGDLDKYYQDINPENFNKYKINKTEGRYGIKIENIIDTLYLGHSHNSRLIQLADVYTYTCALQKKKKPSKVENALVEYYKTLDIKVATFRNYPS